MASFNKVILIGNLTADPEVKQSKSGAHVCTFNIAINRKFAKDGEQNADFIPIVAWRERADFVGKYFNKGKPILVCGQIQTRTWSDKDGNRRTSTEVVADEVTFVGGRDTDANDTGYMPESYTASMTAPAFEDVSSPDNLPF